MSEWPLVVTLAGKARTKNRRQVTVDNAGRPHMHYDRGNQRYEAQLRHAMQQAMAGLPPSAEPMEVLIDYRLPIPVSWSKRKQAAAELGQARRTTYPDYDRIANMVGDAGNQVIWLDDKQIVEARVRKVYSRSPGLTVIVSPLVPPASAASVPGERAGAASPAAADLFAGAAS